jgi:hypothetical protein
MSRRGLVAALLCGVIGVAGGVLVAWLVQPRPAAGGLADPVPGVSPSVPEHQSSRSPYAPDDHYPPLSPDLPLQAVHTMRNRLAIWTYHVPQDWTAYETFGTTPLTPHQIEHSQSLRFKPADSHEVGDYSLYVKMLDNTLFDTNMSVAAKIAGFSEASGVADFQVLYQNDSSVYFEYRDKPTNLHRYNYFAWFAVPGDPYATLQVSVAGRRRDVPGLKALLNRFTDDLTGVRAPHRPPSGGTSSSPASPPATPPTSPTSPSSS